MRVVGWLATGLIIAASALSASSACVSSGRGQGRGQPAAHPYPVPHPDIFVARLKALALIQTLNANILSSTSATTTLESWCRDHALAVPPRIAATRIQSAERPASAEQRARLGVGDTETIRHRRVQLRCGDRVLSEADNWYVPGRLTTEMNRLLDTTDTPFGRAVQPLGPYRRTLEVRMLWAPLPDGWEREPRESAAAAAATVAGPLTIPDALFEHRAVLYTRDHTPFSEVHEVYQRELLAFLVVN
jgi:chorismate-pyruvate lyase